MNMTRVFLSVLFSLIVGLWDRPSSAQPLKCSEHYNTTCDHMGNATLDTAELPKDEDCYWSIRDENDTNLQPLTPSSNITVPCTFAKIRVKVHCINQKRDSVACYTPVNENNNKRNADKTKSGAARHHFWLFVPVVLFLIVLVVLVVLAIHVKLAKKATNDVNALQ